MKSRAGAHGFGQILLPRCSVVVREMDAGTCRDVGKVDFRLLVDCACEKGCYGEHAAESSWIHGLSQDISGETYHMLVKSKTALVFLSLFLLGATVDQDRLWHYRNLGKAFYENPTTQKEAVEQFRKALELAPDSARERVNYGLALLKAARPSKRLPSWSGRRNKILRFRIRGSIWES